MSSIVLEKEQIFIDELIRENARLTIQHEADQRVIRDLRDQVATEEFERQEMAVLKRECEVAKYNTQVLEAKLSKAVEDLHFVMAGGDPCKVCTVRCAFGEEECKPVWRCEIPKEAADE